MTDKRKASTRNGEKRQYTQREKPSKLALEVATMLRAKEWKIIDTRHGKGQDAIVFGKNQDVNKALMMVSDVFPNTGLKQTGKSTIIVPFQNETKSKKKNTVAVPKKKRQRSDTVPVEIGMIVDMVLGIKRPKVRYRIAEAVMRGLPEVSRNSLIRKLVNGSLPGKRKAKTDLSKISPQVLMAEIKRRMKGK